MEIKLTNDQKHKLTEFLKSILTMNIFLLLLMGCIVAFGAYALTFFIDLSNQFFGHPAPGILFAVALGASIPIVYILRKKW